MDILLSIVGAICIIAGFLGCFLPILPGPPLSYIGLLLLHFTSAVQFTTPVLLVLGILTVLVTIGDQVLPVWMTKKLGGTKYGVWGATLGLLAGLIFFGPLGAILMPFVGALIGELIAGVESKKAMKSALGSFVGFLLGTGIKLILCGVIAFYFISALVKAF